MQGCSLGQQEPKALAKCRMFDKLFKESGQSGERHGLTSVEWTQPRRCSLGAASTVPVRVLAKVRERHRQVRMN